MEGEFMFSISTVKAYVLLITAIVNGESYYAAGPNYFVAACYLDGYEWHYCVEMKNEGLLNNAFPIHLD